MKKTILIMTVLLGVYSVFAEENGKDPKDKYQVKIFGIKKSEPVDSGFFFYSGKYIPPPYVVRQTGNAIMINDFITWGPVPYTPYKKPVIPETMPEVPKGITKDTDFDSDVLGEYCSKLYRFIICGQKDKTMMERTQILAKKYRELPCIKSVKVVSCNRLEIELHDGSSLGERLTPFTRTVMALKNRKEKDVIKSMKNCLVRNYDEQVRILKEGGVLVGMRSFLPVKSTDTCPADLYKFVGILNSEKSFDEKTESLKQTFIWEHTADEDVLNAFRNYEYSKELTERVESLYIKWKTEHPDEFKQYERDKRRKPFLDQYYEIYDKFEDKGEEYRLKHQDEYDKILKQLKELDSKIKSIK